MKKFLDIICFVVGPMICVFSLASFGHRGLVGFGRTSPIYYSFEAKIGIALGVCLICMGILKRHWRK